MSENIDKFNSLEKLIEEYVNLVVKDENKEKLGIHVLFNRYKNQSKYIREKIQKIEDSQDEEKIQHIIEFTIPHVAVSDIQVKYKNEIIVITPPKKAYLHSFSNAARLTSNLLGTQENEEKENILNGENILKYGDLIIECLDFFKVSIKNKAQEFWTYDNIEKYINKKESKFLKKRVLAPFDELKFWYYATNPDDKNNYDSFPLENGSLTQTLSYLNNIYFDKDKDEKKLDIKGLKAIFDTKLNNKELDLPIYLYIDQLANLIHKLKPLEIKKENIKDGDESILCFYQKLWNTIQPVKQESMQEDLNKFKNIIYHGAPGTSKTFQLKEDIKEHISIQGNGKYEFIQFHGSYYYEDFIGGLKPTGDDNLTLKYTNGIFKQLCKEAAKYEIAYYLLPDIEELTEKTTAPKKLELKDPDNNEITLLTIEKGENILSQFPPFFIIIDEINRADLSKVFGELLFAIEDDYRGIEHAFKLSSSNIEKKDSAVYWKGDETNGEAYFFVPKNLYIRGTMNDIDKSVDSIDFAFRRRFKWEEKKFDDNKIVEIIEDKGLKDLNLNGYIKNCRKLNNDIVKNISIADESYKIGHAIFANIVKYLNSNNAITKNSKEQLFDNHIEPILYNYLKMDYGNTSSDVKSFRDDFIK